MGEWPAASDETAKVMGRPEFTYEEPLLDEAEAIGLARLIAELEERTRATNAAVEPVSPIIAETPAFQGDRPSESSLLIAPVAIEEAGPDREAIATLCRALLAEMTARPGLFLLSGEAAADRAAVLSRLAHDLRAGGHFSSIVPADGLSVRDLLFDLALKAGIAPPAMSGDNEWLPRFHKVVGARNALIMTLIDEAEQLEEDVWAELQILLRGTPEQPAALRLLLAGGAKLGERIAASAGLKDEVRASHTITRSPEGVLVADPPTAAPPAAVPAILESAQRKPARTRLALALAACAALLLLPFSITPVTSWLRTPAGPAKIELPLPASTAPSSEIAATEEHALPATGDETASASRTGGEVAEDAATVSVAAAPAVPAPAVEAPVAPAASVDPPAAPAPGVEAPAAAVAADKPPVVAAIEPPAAAEPAANAQDEAASALAEIAPSAGVAPAGSPQLTPQLTALPQIPSASAPEAPQTASADTPQVTAALTPPATPPSPPAEATPQPPASVPAAPLPPGSAALPQETIVALIQRGDRLLALRDIAAARSCYERAALAGNGAAALAAGRTYDPQYLRDTGVLGIPPDAAKAAQWYRKALALGETKAEQRLKALGASTEE